MEATSNEAIIARSRRFIKHFTDGESNTTNSRRKLQNRMAQRKFRMKPLAHMLFILPGTDLIYQTLSSGEKTRARKQHIAHSAEEQTDTPALEIADQVQSYPEQISNPNFCSSMCWGPSLAIQDQYPENPSGAGFHSSFSAPVLGGQQTYSDGGSMPHVCQASSHFLQSSWGPSTTVSIFISAQLIVTKKL